MDEMGELLIIYRKTFLHFTIQKNTLLNSENNFYFSCLREKKDNIDRMKHEKHLELMHKVIEMRTRTIFFFAMRSRTMKGRVSSPVILAFSLPSVQMSLKCHILRGQGGHGSGHPTVSSVALFCYLKICINLYPCISSGSKNYKQLHQNYILYFCIYH